LGVKLVGKESTKTKKKMIQFVAYLSC